MRNSLFLRALSIATLVLLTSFAHAQTQIQVTIETAGNLGLAPTFASFSDGSFDLFNVGSAASAGLELSAETGNPSAFVAPVGVNAGPIFGNNPSPPIFTPNGGSNSAIFTVDAGNNQFNFVNMILPSNDWFVGNSSSIDVSSLLSGPAGSSITMSFGTVYDAGTELEDFTNGPGNPILAGITGLTFPAGTDQPDTPLLGQGGVVSVVSNPDFSLFANAPAGLDNSLVNFDNIVTVTLTTVPEPNAGVLALFCLGGFAAMARRRRRR